MKALLVFFHCPAESGYAIARLERVFAEVGRQLVGTDERVHFAYPALSAAQLAAPAAHPRLIRFDPATAQPHEWRAVSAYVARHGIDAALGFDQPVRRPAFGALRAGGIRTLVSYWGAPMSSVNHGLKLALKRLEVRLTGRGGPDHYIFESMAMQNTAVRGRGIPATRTSVTYLGVDTDRFRPAETPSWYAHDTFGIPRNRRIVYYSGHMEERKGVRVILNAAVELVDRKGLRDVHFLLLGNRAGEELAFDSVYRGHVAEGHITFGGYRDDIERLVPCAHLGAIASTGWDSFTMSSLEIAACGVPLIVSRLPGLDETVDDGETGLTFPVGDHHALADRLAQLLGDDARRNAMSRAARARTLSRFTTERQIASLVDTVRRVDDGMSGHPRIEHE